MSSVATMAIPAGIPPVPVHVLNPDLNSEARSHTKPTVFVLDDDPHFRRSVELLARSRGWQVRICGSAGECVVQPRPSTAACLLLAFSAKDASCPEIQSRIARECSEMSIIVVTDYEDTRTTVRAMKAGAVDFLLKPFGEELLASAICQGLTRSRAALDRRREIGELRNRYASLTPREQQVLTRIALGLLNKEVGRELGISEITVKAHRGQVMHKMKADSFAHLVNMAMRLRLTR